LGGLAVVGAARVRRGAASRADAADKPPRPSDNYDELYHRYLSEARASERTPIAAATSFAWMSQPGVDPRARNVNDLVTIRIVESIEAIGSADSALSKNSSAQRVGHQAVRLETKFPDWLDPTNLVDNAASNTQFKGGGATSRSRRAHGDDDGARRRGAAKRRPRARGRPRDRHQRRPADRRADRRRAAERHRRNNVVLSPAGRTAAHPVLRPRAHRDNLQPGWLVRVLNKIF
jgi:hypothetical protein